MVPGTPRSSKPLASPEKRGGGSIELAEVTGLPVSAFESEISKRVNKGVARNPCISALLREVIGKDILVPEDPQMVGALGAAMLARRIK